MLEGSDRGAKKDCACVVSFWRVGVPLTKKTGETKLPTHTSTYTHTPVNSSVRIRPRWSSSRRASRSRTTRERRLAACAVRAVALA